MTAQEAVFAEKRWRDAFARSGLRTCADFFDATGEPLSKAGLGRRYRARLPLEMGAQRRITYLKRFHGEPLKDRLRRWFENGAWRSAAEHEVLVSQALRQSSIAAPEALAWGCTGCRLSPRSFVVHAAVPGMPLSSWVERQLDGGPCLDWGTRRVLVRQLAELVSAFHAAGWRHRDLYLCHLFVAQRGDGFHVSLIDLQRIFRPRWRARRWQVKDLAQLNHSASPAFFSRAMKLRFLLWYTGGKRLGDAEKKLIGAIAAKTRAMARRSGA